MPFFFQSVNYIQTPTELETLERVVRRMVKTRLRKKKKKKNDGRCFGRTSVIHGEGKHVSPIPMWLRALLLNLQLLT